MESWYFVCCVLVFLMIPGVIFYDAGGSDSRHAVHSILIGLLCFIIVTIEWIAFGYSLAFSPHWDDWVGFKDLMVSTPNDCYNASVPPLVFAFYQMMFSVVTLALVTVVFIGRVRLRSAMLFIVLWCVVYDINARFVWNNYDLDGSCERDRKWLDFAGGLVVHYASGVATLVLSFFVKPPVVENTRPHDMIIEGLGAFLLAVGWIGFNSGSGQTSFVAILAAVNTIAAAAGAAATRMFMERIVSGYPIKVIDVLGGLFLGMISITPGSGYVYPHAAIIFGALAAIFYHMCKGGLDRLVNSRMKKSGTEYWAEFHTCLGTRRLYYPAHDAIEQFSSHGVAAVVGTLATAFFASKDLNSEGQDGIIYSGGGTLLGYQVAAICITTCLVAIPTLIISAFVWILWGMEATLSQLNLWDQKKVVFQMIRKYDLTSVQLDSKVWGRLYPAEIPDPQTIHKVKTIAKALLNEEDFRMDSNTGFVEQGTWTLLFEKLIARKNLELLHEVFVFSAISLQQLEERWSILFSFLEERQEELRQRFNVTNLTEEIWKQILLEEGVDRIGMDFVEGEEYSHILNFQPPILKLGIPIGRTLERQDPRNQEMRHRV